MTMGSEERRKAIEWAKKLVLIVSASLPVPLVLMLTTSKWTRLHGDRSTLRLSRCNASAGSNPRSGGSRDRPFKRVLFQCRRSRACARRGDTFRKSRGR